MFISSPNGRIGASQHFHRVELYTAIGEEFTILGFLITLVVQPRLVLSFGLR
jgi:hypothetical protein